MLKRYIWNLPLIIVFSICCLMPLVFGSLSRDNRVWRGYYLVAVPEEKLEQTLDGWLSSFHVISSSNSQFIYNDFGEMKTVAFKDLENRFIEGDPRVDQYMLQAPEYFKASSEDGGNYEMIWVKTSLPFISFYSQLKRNYGSSVNDWIIPDMNLSYRLAAVLLLSLCMALGVWMMKGMRLIAAAGALPWMIFTALISPDLLSAATVLYIIFVIAMKEINPDLLYYMNYREKRISSAAVFAAAAVLTASGSAVVAQILQGIPVMPVAAAILADLTLAAGYFIIRKERVQRQEHLLFFPVRIKNAPGAELLENKGIIYSAAIAAMILLPLFTIYIHEDLPAGIPVPEKTAGVADWEWESLRLLDGKGSQLPDASDYLTHMAFQDGFMYGRAYGFPVENEKIMLTRYRSREDGIVREQICARQFTDDWYKDIIRPETVTGLDELILSRDRPDKIVIKSDLEVVPRYTPLRHLIISLAALLPVLWQYISRLRIIIRRKGQEA